MKLKKMTALFMAVSLAWGSLSVQALPVQAFQQNAVGSDTSTYKPASRNIKSRFQIDGYHFYDIHDGAYDGRTHVNRMDTFIRDALTSVPVKKDENREQKPTLLRRWADLACGIFAATPSSYASYGDEDAFGEEKSEQIFKKRFKNDVCHGGYGKLQELLSSTSRQKTRSNNAWPHADRWQDVVTQSTGLQSARNLAQVQQTAFRELADLNRCNANINDFKAHNEIQYMSNDTDENKCLYTMVATRDRQGAQFCYDYNLLGLVFYDFNLQEIKKNDENLILSALDDQDKEVLEQQIKEGQDITFDGFSFKDNKSETINTVQTSNMNRQSVNTEMSLTSSITKNQSTSETHNNNYKMTEDLQVGWTHNFGPMSPSSGTYLNMFTNQISVNFKWGNEQSWGESKTESNGVTEQSSISTKHTVTVPAHTVMYLKNVKEELSMEEEYSHPVMVSYKVAVFSMNGRYYDDDWAILSFPTAGYQQRSFFTEIGSRENKSGAWFNLNERAVENYDSDNVKAITRVIGNKHAYRQDYNWTNPFVDKLDWNQVYSKSANIDIPAKEAVETLTTCLPISLTGGILRTNLSLTDVKVEDTIPVYSLEQVVLEESSKSEYSLMPGQSLNLSEVKLKGIDRDNVPFYTFNPSKGTWKFVDENGQFLDGSELGVLEVNSSNNLCFKANNSKSGKVFLKYVVEDKYYKYYRDGEYYSQLPTVQSEDVITPVIAVNCRTAESAFDGVIEVPEEISVNYVPGEPIDLSDLEDLEAFIFDSQNNQLRVQPAWGFKESRNCCLDGTQMTFYKDGIYHLRAQYGTKYSKWIDVYAKAAEPALPEEDQEDTDAVNYQDLAASFCQTFRAGKINGLDLLLSANPDLADFSFDDSAQAFQLLKDRGLFNNQDSVPSAGTESVSIKDLAVFLYAARTQFGFCQEVDAPAGFDELADLSWVSEQHLPALKWAMACGLDLHDLARKASLEETEQFLTNGLSEIGFDAIKSRYKIID